MSNLNPNNDRNVFRIFINGIDQWVYEFKEIGVGLIDPSLHNWFQNDSDFIIWQGIKVKAFGEKN